MKIIHLVSYFQPQMGYQEYFLAVEHKKMGHEVTVITSDRYFPFPDYDNTSFAILGERIIGTGTFIEDGITIIRMPIMFEVSARVWLKNLAPTIKKLNPDIIISHGMYNFSTIRLSYMALPSKTKVVIDDHMTQNLVRPGTLSEISYWLFRRFFRNQVQKTAWKIVGVYQDTVKLLIKNMGFSPQKVQWISMGSDTSHFFANEAIRDQFRKKLGIEEGVTIIYTGKLNETKMVHLLIEVLNEPEFEGISRNLLVVGGIAKSYQAIWQQSFSSAKFKVLYHPPVKGYELQEWFNAADIAAWPAHTTISSLDAAACGCAIICPDYIDERVANQNGIAIKEGDRQALKNALLIMLTQPIVLAEMRKNSTEYIMNTLNWPNIAKRFIE